MKRHRTEAQLDCKTKILKQYLECYSMNDKFTNFLRQSLGLKKYRRISFWYLAFVCPAIHIKKEIKGIHPCCLEKNVRSRGFNLSSTLGHERHETRERLYGVGEAPELLSGLLLAFSLPSSKSTFSQPFKDKHLSDAVRIDRMIIFHLRISDEKPSTV